MNPQTFKETISFYSNSMSDNGLFYGLYTPKEIESLTSFYIIREWGFDGSDAHEFLNSYQGILLARTLIKHSQEIQIDEFEENFSECLLKSISTWEETYRPIEN